MKNKKFVGVKCNLCGSDDFYVIYKSNIGDCWPSVKEYTSTVNEYSTYNDIVRCRKCGLVYMNPRDNNLSALYEGVVDKEYIDSWKDREMTFLSHLRVIKNYKKSGNLLDVGCYAGIFPNLAVKKGYKVTGVEPSRWAAKYAKQKSNAKILRGSWDTVSLKKNSYDVATLWDVIEHLGDPFGCLKKVHSCLKDGGIVVITTHDIGSLLSKIMGKKYPWLMRFHVYHFTPKTLGSMLEKAGFECEEIKYYSKLFSVRYLLSRFGINIRDNFFSRIEIPINTRDMFMIIARKRGVNEK